MEEHGARTGYPMSQQVKSVKPCYFNLRRVRRFLILNPINEAFFFGKKKRKLINYIYIYIYFFLNCNNIFKDSLSRDEVFKKKIIIKREKEIFADHLNK